MPPSEVKGGGPEGGALLDKAILSWSSVTPGLSFTRDISWDWDPKVTVVCPAGKLVGSIKEEVVRGNGVCCRRELGHRRRGGGRHLNRLYHSFGIVRRPVCGRHEAEEYVLPGLKVLH
jgi:hypothetical protein